MIYSSMQPVAGWTTSGGLDVQLAAVVKEGVGVELGDLHDGLVLPLGALEHLVLAGVGVGGQVAHVGDVHDPVHVIAVLAQELLQHVLHDIGAQVADVGEVVHRGAAGVHLHMAGGCGSGTPLFFGWPNYTAYIKTSFCFRIGGFPGLLRYCSSMSFSKNSSRGQAAASSSFRVSPRGSGPPRRRSGGFPRCGPPGRGRPRRCASGGTSPGTTALAAMRALSPTVKGPSTLAPEPTSTLLPSGGVALALVLAGAAQGHPLVEQAVVPISAVSPDDDAHAVVDDQAAADGGAGVDLNAGPEPAPLREKEEELPEESIGGHGGGNGATAGGERKGHS